MSISKIRSVVVLAATLSASVAGLAPLPSALAQPQTCPTAGADAVVLEVTSPKAGEHVEGRVEVEGRFKGSVPVFQVELFVGDSRKDAVDVTPPVDSGSFTLAWDTTGSPGGPVRLGVFACGGDPAAGSLVRGTAAVDIEVGATAATSPAPSPLVPAKTKADDSGSKPWVGLAMGVPGLVGLGYALGVRPARRRSRARPSAPPSTPA